MKDIQPGRWDTSVGGHLAIGKTYEQAASGRLRKNWESRQKDLCACTTTHGDRGGRQNGPRTFLVRHEGPFLFNRMKSPRCGSGPRRK